MSDYAARTGHSPPSEAAAPPPARLDPAPGMEAPPYEALPSHVSEYWRQQQRLQQAKQQVGGWPADWPAGPRAIAVRAEVFPSGTGPARVTLDNSSVSNRVNRACLASMLDLPSR